jgi:integrase/recombinase XerD
MFSSVTEVAPMTTLRQRMLEDLRIRNYAPTTGACYIRSVAEFARHFNKPPDQLGPEEIRAWQLFLAQGKASQALHLHSGRLRAPILLPEHAAPENRDRPNPIASVWKEAAVILSKSEVKALLEAPKNLKHRAMQAAMYGAGLRVSEAANLKVCDLDRERHVIWVRGGKGHKDRQVMLAEPLRDLLAAYWRWKRPAEWLFPGRKPDCPIGTNSVFGLAKKRRGRPVSPSRFIRIHCVTMPLPGLCRRELNRRKGKAQTEEPWGWKYRCASQGRTTS